MELEQAEHEGGGGEGRGEDMKQNTAVPHLNNTGHECLSRISL